MGPATAAGTAGGPVRATAGGPSGSPAAASR